jgi:hypothetical protein
MNSTSITDKRKALQAARLRFSAEAQSVRQAAIDGLVKQSLALADEGRMTLPQLEGAVAEDVGPAAINLPDLRESTSRLVASGEVEGMGHGLNHRTYGLTESARSKLQNDYQTSQRRLGRVTTRIFANAPGGPERYREPFLECLVHIFSQVADIYVRLLRAEVEHEEFATGVVVRRALEIVTGNGKGFDAKALDRGVYAFLTKTDADFDEIKFNMTQNYYVARMLGLHESGRLLSREVFGEAILYLDTNVFFHALEPQARLYRQLNRRLV